MRKTVNLAGLRLHTNVQAGNLISDNCYYQRNTSVFGCSLLQWPQNGGDCTGNKLEQNLKECLYDSGEPNWWKDFPGCTSAKQCYEKRFE